MKLFISASLTTYSCTEHLGNPLSITFSSHGCTPAGGLILLKLADHHLKKCLKVKCELV